MDFSQWANRRGGRASQEPRQAPAPRPQQVAGHQAPSLPQAPAGFAWSVMGGQYVLVPLAAPPVHMHPAQTTIVAPTRQPAAVMPFNPHSITSPVHAGSPAAMPETCLLVKPGNRDTYAEFLATQPELVPDQGFNADAGNPNPAVMAELRGCSEYAGGDGAVHPEAPLRAFPNGANLIPGSAPLKGAA